MASDRLYTVPAIKRPTTEQLRLVAEALHLHISADELEEYRSIGLLIVFIVHKVVKLIK